MPISDLVVLDTPVVTELLLRLPGLRRGLAQEHKFWLEAVGSGHKIGGGSFRLFSNRSGFCIYDYERVPKCEKWNEAEMRLFGCGCIKCIRNRYPDYKGTRELTVGAELDRICGVKRD